MAEFVPVDPFDIVIFGVSGDLSRQKLLPALFHRYCDGQIDETCRIIGVARSRMDDEVYLNMVRESCQAATDGDFPEDMWSGFAKLLRYHEIDATSQQADWQPVKESFMGDDRPRIFYLAVGPRL